MGKEKMNMTNLYANLSRKDRLRMFWQGKRKKTKFCVELWLSGGITQHEIHMKYGYSPNSMHRVLKGLRLVERACGKRSFG